MQTILAIFNDIMNALQIQIQTVFRLDLALGDSLLHK